jgi:hypothetical protein
MRLHGRARLDFNDWILEEDSNFKIVDYGVLVLGLIPFDDLPEFIIYSCYRRWLSSVSIEIGRHDTNSWWLYTDNKKYTAENSCIDIRIKREISTLHRAMEIYNEYSIYSKRKP